MIRFGSRILWDVALFHILIKKRGRVPSSDSWLVKRVAGPGLSNEHFFQVSYCAFQFVNLFYIIYLEPPYFQKINF